MGGHPSGRTAVGPHGGALCLRVSHGGEVAPLPEQGVGLFEHAGEPVPALGRVGVEGGGAGVPTALLCVDRAHGHECVLCDGEGFGDVGGEPVEQVKVAGGGGSPCEHRQRDGVEATAVARRDGLVEQRLDGVRVAGREVGDDDSPGGHLVHLAAAKDLEADGALGRAQVVVDRPLGTGEGHGDREMVGELGKDAGRIGFVELLECLADAKVELRQSRARDAVVGASPRMAGSPRTRSRPAMTTPATGPPSPR